MITICYTLGAAFTESNIFSIDIMAVIVVMYLVGSLIGESELRNQILSQNRAFTQFPLFNDSVGESLIL